MGGSRKKPKARSKTKTRTRTKPDAVGPFERVWSIARRIPSGRVATYGQLSEMIEHRLSPVGIGWAIRAAPEESIPWHRVVNSIGGISTDREHPGLQRAMLEAEGVGFDREGRVDMTRAAWRPRSAWLAWTRKTQNG
jgi:methylated-DNA-protein-cysteine methyltransferase-like protein